MYYIVDEINHHYIESYDREALYAWLYFNDDYYDYRTLFYKPGSFTLKHRLKIGAEEAMAFRSHKQACLFQRYLSNCPRLKGKEISYIYVQK